MNGAAAGLSFVFVGRVVGVVTVTGTVAGRLELERLFRWRRNTEIVLRKMVPQVRANDPRCKVLTVSEHRVDHTSNDKKRV